MDLTKQLADNLVEANKELQEHENTNHELHYEYDEKVEELK